MVNYRIIEETPLEIIDIVREQHREIDAILAFLNSSKLQYKGTVREYQAACLYALAKPYNVKEARILEIGTGKGYSTSFLAQSCPNAEIITISARQDESDEAKRVIEKELGFKNVEFVVAKSWEYYIKNQTEPKFDFIFVDGDHAKVQRDLVWYEELHKDGLILFHDYCPENASNPQTHVYNVLNKWLVDLGKDDFDVKIVDNELVGMVGLYNR